jgi:hypothetical protein
MLLQINAAAAFRGRDDVPPPTDLHLAVLVDDNDAGRSRDSVAVVDDRRKVVRWQSVTTWLVKVSATHACVCACDAQNGQARSQEDFGAQ